MLNNNNNIHYIKCDDPDLPALNAPHIIWVHGWGQTHASLLPLANNFRYFSHNWLIDLPGFGNSAQPQEIAGSLEYAAMIAAWIKQHIPSDAKKIWVGHSFGGKIGVMLAARYPELINGLFLIAASGIPRKRTVVQQIIIKIKIAVFKLLKYATNNNLGSLKTKFGSADYRNATNPHMRAILVKIVNENLANIAKEIICPTELIYGELDNETPVTIGQEFNKLINNSKIHIIPRQDHYNILYDTKQQLMFLLKKFIGTITC